MLLKYQYDNVPFTLTFVLACPLYIAKKCCPTGSWALARRAWRGFLDGVDVAFQ